MNFSAIINAVTPPLHPRKFISARFVTWPNGTNKSPLVFREQFDLGTTMTKILDRVFQIADTTEVQEIKITRPEA